MKIKMPKRVHDWDEFLDRIVDGNDVIAERAVFFASYKSDVDIFLKCVMLIQIFTGVI